MGTSETVTGSGNTPLPGLVTIGSGVTKLVDDATVGTTIEGSGQTSIAVTLGLLGTTLPMLYLTGGGSGSITANGPGDTLLLTGSKWLVNGSSAGAETIYSAADNSTISVGGNGAAQNQAGGIDTTPSNVVELAGGNALVHSSGTHDLIESFAGSDTVNITGSADVLVDGGHVTLGDFSNQPVIAYFAGTGGGKLNFINSSSVAATVSGNVPGGSGGSVTVFGGAGGGVYIGGSAGNNSLVGGSAGAVTLVAHGNNNYLKAAAYSSSYAHQNILEGGSGSQVLVATSTSGYNEFYGGTGASTIESSGQGAQTYYLGASGTESIVGSALASATNEYILDQDSSGAGQDTITNFKFGKDHIDINRNGSLSGVSIEGFSALSGTQAGSVIMLSNNTKITLYGVNEYTLSPSLIGGTHI